MATPLMTQYHRIKAEAGDAILFFRMGDFYEMFEGDAVTASRVLGLTLTSRNHGGSANTPLCGFPYHALERYTARMIRAGLKIAICDQVEDPKTAKGIVQRDVVEVITRGTAVNPEILLEKSNNYIVAVAGDEKGAGLAVCDVSTGEFFLGDLPAHRLAGELAKLGPTELLYPAESGKAGPPPALNAALPGTVFTGLDGWRFGRDAAYKALTAHFKTATLEGFGVEGLGAGIAAAGALFRYVAEMKRDRVDHIRRLAPYTGDRHMVLDAATLRNLELVAPLHADDEKSTLLHVLDQTRTAMGGRLLKRFLVNPLLDLDEIKRRQDGVEAFFSNAAFRNKAVAVLARVCDIERMNGRIGGERVTPRDLSVLMTSLIAAGELPALVLADAPAIVKNAAAPLCRPAVGEVIKKLKNALVDEPPVTINDGNIFRPGHSPELDALVEGAREGKEWIAALQQRERERTGIGSLKVGYTRVFGYYIEVSRTHLDRVPPDYLRKQTIVNGERFITEDLKKWEDVVLSAEERQKSMEADLFTELRKWVAVHIPALQEAAEGLALLDVLSSLAAIAERNAYVRPEVNAGDEIRIEDGRHPVIESLDFSEAFVPNNLSISGSGQFIHLITGPNMAGKSTFLRQVGLITLLAQTGSFVPARSAMIGRVDRIFTRVGASDRLSKGLSTFLVEMQELANILNNATAKSLVLLDEIGRGTSTFDGLSIAWALVEHIHEKIRAKTLFATHYHELTELPLVLPGVKNFNVSVKEWNEEIIFLRKIVEGACDHSYGIQVARLAGVPQEVLVRAREVLRNLEENELTPDQKPALARHLEKKESRPVAAPAEDLQLTLFDSANSEALDCIRKLDVDNLTPVEALMRLAEIRKKLLG
ncbi:MAG: DNA mismatch repair protein MutS [Fibrobacterota bacterium]